MKNICLSCGKKIPEDDLCFCLLCEKIYQDAYIDEVVKDGI